MTETDARSTDPVRLRRAASIAEHAVRTLANRRPSRSEGLACKVSRGGDDVILTVPYANGETRVSATYASADAGVWTLTTFDPFTGDMLQNVTSPCHGRATLAALLLTAFDATQGDADEEQAAGDEQVERAGEAAADVDDTDAAVLDRAVAAMLDAAPMLFEDVEDDPERVAVLRRVAAAVRDDI